MKKIIIAAVIAVVAVAGIAAVVLNSKKDSNKKTSSTSHSGTQGSSSSNGSNGSNSEDMNNMDSSNTASGSSSSSSAGTGSTASPAATDKVSIADFAYTPASITVKKGTSVTWTNEDTSQHTVTIDDGTGPHSQPLNKGDTYTYTFSDAGTYKYHCTFHSNMTGTVIVTE